VLDELDEPEGEALDEEVPDDEADPVGVLEEERGAAARRCS
jgi:hypothetical protein